MPDRRKSHYQQQVPVQRLLGWLGICGIGGVCDTSAYRKAPDINAPQKEKAAVRRLLDSLVKPLRQISISVAMLERTHVV